MKILFFLRMFRAPAHVIDEGFHFPPHFVSSLFMEHDYNNDINMFYRTKTSWQSYWHDKRLNIYYITVNTKNWSSITS